MALEILLSALVDCPHTAPLWMVLETNYYSRDSARGWFSFGESWLVDLLGGLQAKRPHRAVSRQITEWLENGVDLSRLFVEADFDRRPRADFLPELPFLLGRCLRVHTITAANGATRPVDERADDERTDRVAALTYSGLKGHINARPLNPPRWSEPPKCCIIANSSNGYPPGIATGASWPASCGS